MNRSAVPRTAMPLALLFLAMPLPAIGQTAVAPPVAPVPLASPELLLPRVAIVTSAGIITLMLERGKAPATVANFLKYVDGKRLDGASFYRALRFPAPTPTGLVQGGIRGRSDKVLPPVAHEPTSRTGLNHDDGAISMARAAPGTANGDFFIILGDLRGLDASEKDPGYAVFGRVVEGMDVVRAIQAAPVSPTAGEGAMKGQMLLKPVTLVSARRLAPMARPAPPVPSLPPAEPVSAAAAAAVPAEPAAGQSPR